MNFIKTICWKFINWNDISFCCYRKDDDERNRIYPYFFLKNGEKIDAFDACDIFIIEPDGPEFIFCIKCCVIYFEILINNINDFFIKNPSKVYDIEKHEDELWEEFIEKIKLEKYLETKNEIIKLSFNENNKI
jgi:hypothetical protein